VRTILFAVAFGAIATFAFPNSSEAALENVVPVTGLGAPLGTELRFTFEVPAGASNLRFEMSGGSGDADLYVRYGNAPTLQLWDCRPYANTSNETCAMPTASAGTWHVMVHAFTNISGVTLKASYSGGT
jgi:serine protease